MTRLVTRCLGVPVAHVSFVESERPLSKSEVGLADSWTSRRETAINHSFCRYVVADGRPLIVSDTRQNERLKNSPAIEDMGVIAYVGVPICLPTGEVVGSLCAIDHRPRNWTEAEVAAMQDLAATVSTEIELRFEVARRKAAEAEILLVARELQHRARNAFSIIQAVISLSMRDKALLPLKLEIIDRISTVSATQELIANQPDGVVDFADIVGRELTPLAPPERFELTGPTVWITANEAVFVGMIIHELTTNAIKYGALRSDSEAHLTLAWTNEPYETDQALKLIWRESGLVSIKGSDWTVEAESGFGSELLQILVSNQLKGSIQRTLSEDCLTIEMALQLALPTVEAELSGKA